MRETLNVIPDKNGNPFYHLGNAGTDVLDLVLKFEFDMFTKSKKNTEE